MNGKPAPPQPNICRHHRRQRRGTEKRPLCHPPLLQAEFNEGEKKEQNEKEDKDKGSTKMKDDEIPGTHTHTHTPPREALLSDPKAS